MIRSKHVDIFLTFIDTNKTHFLIYCLSSLDMSTMFPCVYFFLGKSVSICHPKKSWLQFKEFYHKTLLQIINLVEKSMYIHIHIVDTYPYSNMYMTMDTTTTKLAKFHQFKTILKVKRNHEWSVIWGIL